MRIGGLDVLDVFVASCETGFSTPSFLAPVRYAHSSHEDHEGNPINEKLCPVLTLSAPSASSSERSERAVKYF